MKITSWGTNVMLMLVPAFAVNSQNPAQHDWENELVIGINKESARAHAIPYATIQEATKDLRLKSPYLLDLNGTWRFNWVTSIGGWKTYCFRQTPNGCR